MLPVIRTYSTISIVGGISYVYGPYGYGYVELAMWIQMICDQKARQKDDTDSRTQFCGIGGVTFAALLQFCRILLWSLQL